MKKVTKEHLDTCVQAHKDEMKRALELIFANLNHGQTQKLLKNEEILELVQRYKVQTN